MVESPIPTPPVDPDDGAQDDRAKAQHLNKIVLEMTRKLNGLNMLEINLVLKDVSRLAGLTSVLDIGSPEFVEQERFFKLHAASPSSETN